MNQILGQGSSIKNIFYKPILNIIELIYHLSAIIIQKQGFPTSSLPFISFFLQLRHYSTSIQDYINNPMNNKKLTRFVAIDSNSNPKQDKNIIKPNLLMKSVNQIQNKSLESQKHIEKQNQHQISMYVDQFDQKSRAINKCKKSRQNKEIILPVKLLQSQGANNHENVKQKNRFEGSNEKQLNNRGRQIFIKHPEWLKARKRENEQRISSDPKYHEQKNKIKPNQIDINSTATNNQIHKIRSGSMAYLTIMQENGGWFEKGGKDNQEKKEEKTNRRFSKIQYLQIRNIKLQEEIKQLQYRLQNLEQDNNILLGRMQTLEAELSSSNKKIMEYNTREDHHKAVQIKLRQKIEDLQSKLIMANNQISTKNQFCNSAYNEGFSFSGSYDREVVHKKNEQISRLNEIITKTRLKVNQLNQFLSQERINNLQNTKILEQQFEFILERKQNQIKELKRTLEGRKEKGNICLAQSRKVTEIHPLQKSQQGLKRVVSANFIHKDVPFMKFST